MEKTTSGWEAYANQLEQDIKVAEEALSKKNQEIRGLRRQLLEKAPDADLQKQLDRVRQEATNKRTLYQRHIHEFQQQLAAAQRDRNAVVQQTTELERAHKAALREIEDLRAQLAERTQQLQQASDNAKLLKHSREKPNRMHDDSDDEEPEYPKPPEKKARRAQRPSNLDANYSRPGNYSRGPTHKAKPKRSTNATPKPTASPTLVATQQTAAAFSPTATPRSTPRKKPVSIDLVSDDEDHAPAPTSKNTSKSTAKIALPIRKSIHENITVADHSPKGQSTFTDSTASSQTMAKATASDEKVMPKATPSKKRKRTTGASSSGTGRRRSYEQQIRDELPDLAINAKGFDEPNAPRNRRRDSFEKGWDGDDSDDESYTASLEFRFTAVCAYDGDGDVADFYTHRDLESDVEALWERIRDEEDRWQAAWGDYWMYEFTKTRTKASVPLCVSQKCARKPTTWGLVNGRQNAGKYACVDCAKAGRPCFTYIHGGGHSRQKGGFRLLPLKESDRTKKVVKGQETRYWINDERQAVEAEEAMEF